MVYGRRVIRPAWSETVLPSKIVYLTPPGSMESDSKHSNSKPSTYPSSHENLPVRGLALVYIFDTLPRQIYLHFLLRLPRLYFTRVARIFEEAEMSIPKIKQGILEATAHRKDHPESTMSIEFPTVQFGNLEMTWRHFVDSLLQEWQTLNIISVLLLSYVLLISLRFFVNIQVHKQCHIGHNQHHRCSERPSYTLFCFDFNGLRTDESGLRMHIHRSVWNDAQNSQGS